jgi:predicted nucleic acid-binding protein
LYKTFEKSVIPNGVLREFSRKFSELPDFIEVIELDNDQKERAETLGLGLGENEGIILAKDFGVPFVTDDGAVRNLCEKTNVEYFGTFELVRKAYINCVISRERLENIVEKLQNNLYCKQWLIDYVLSAEKQ